MAPCDSCSALADSSWLPDETLSAAVSASATTCAKLVDHRVQRCGEIADLVIAW